MISILQLTASQTIGAMMRDPRSRDHILNLTGGDLLNLQDLLQTVSVVHDMHGYPLTDMIVQLIASRCENYHKLVPLLNKLVMRCTTLPPCLVVTGVSRVGTNPVAGGGFADIWKGLLDGEVVALKVLRIYGGIENHAATYKVGCHRNLGIKRV